MKASSISSPATNDIQLHHFPGFSTMVLEALNDAIIVVDASEYVRYINPAGEQLLGCTTEHVYGRPLKTCLILKSGTTGHILSSPLEYLRMRATHPGDQYDLLVHPKGHEIPVEISSAALHDKRGNLTGHTITLHEATRSHAAIQRLRELATRDHLTRLLNRGEFERRLSQCVDHLREGETHALLYMDLDGFKTVNDSAGHAAGDAALRLVASVFRKTVRDRDTLARIGGDEFGILLEHCPFEMAMQHAEEIRNELRNTEFLWNGRHFHLGVSIGIAMISSGASRTMHDFLMEADLACYAAKHRTRGTRPLCHPMPRYDAIKE
jgi:diguanylate cyclase (GGDEF)-like protein/PAS domain S-box-containing protein